MTIAELIHEHSHKIADPLEFYALVLLHHPDATPQQVTAELRRQAAEYRAEAAELESYPRRRAANDD